MGKRVSNKKGRSRKSPARSTKTGARRLKKLWFRAMQLAKARERQAALENMRRAFSEND